jgi:hypothetical protein
MPGEIRDLRMEQKAVLQRWPMTPEYRKNIIDRNMRIINDPQSTAREVASASKTLMTAEQQNQADEHKFAELHSATRDSELDALASDLGIEICLIEDAARAQDSIPSRTEDPKPTKSRAIKKAPATAPVVSRGKSSAKDTGKGRKTPRGPSRNRRDTTSK